MRDIVEQLRLQEREGWGDVPVDELVTFGDAADEIQRLRLKLSGLRSRGKERGGNVGS